MTSFFPPGYQPPPKQESDYLDLKEPGTYKIRILDSIKVGYEGWILETNDEGKEVSRPYRYKTQEDALKDFEFFKEGKYSYFWAMPVWNYNAQRVQIFRVTQKTIWGVISDLVENPDWGNPLEYDLTITRVGRTKRDTEYSVAPSPPKPLEDAIAKRFAEMKIDWDAWFDSKNPFGKAEAKPQGKRKPPID